MKKLLGLLLVALLACTMFGCSGTDEGGEEEITEDPVLVIYSVNFPRNL